MSSQIDVKELEKVIGYSFKSKEYLITALTHSSFANENGCKSYERTEFLGDSILNFVVAEKMYLEHAGYAEGKLSRSRANLVSEAPLARLSEELELEKFVLLGRSLERVTDAVKADVYEAVIGAIYLDGGMDSARAFVLRTLGEHIGETPKARGDYKSLLLELGQEKKLSIRFEEISRTGPDHDPTFCYAVTVDGVKMGEGTGKSIKSAQICASEVAYKAILAK